MRKFPFRNLTLWLTILTLLWSSQGYGYVWCMTADGPTHLESTLHNHCGHDAPHAAENADGRVTISGAEGEASCGPCLDLTVTDDTLQPRKLSGGDRSPFSSRPSFAPHGHPRSLFVSLATTSSSKHRPGSPRRYWCTAPLFC